MCATRSWADQPAQPLGAFQSAAATKAGLGEVESLVAAFGDFLDAILDPEVCRILITDGPSVLGLERFTELDERFAFAAVVASLERANASGVLAVDAPEALAHLLLGALVRRAMLIATSISPRPTRNVVSATIRDLLLGLRP